MTHKRLTVRFCALAVAAGFLAAAPVEAQDGYFFKEPLVSLGVKLGASGPAASDPLFDFFTSELTLDRGDFEAATFGADLGIRLGSRLETVLSVSTAKSSSRSEFVDWVHQNDAPIQQTTKLMRTPLTAGLKFYPLERGRSVGKHAWVPTRRITPYLGAAAGIMWYKLEQEGEFIDDSEDPEAPDIFRDYFLSEGTTFTTHAFGGAEMWFSSRIGINLEGRYVWGEADLHRAFSEWDRIDLRGWQVTTGLVVRL